ncbi:hypothetical protein BDV06DRAFT_225661 [Aspergillus oleicola]
MASFSLSAADKWRFDPNRASFCLPATSKRAQKCTNILHAAYVHRKLVEDEVLQQLLNDVRGLASYVTEMASLWCLDAPSTVFSGFDRILSLRKSPFYNFSIDYQVFYKMLAVPMSEGTLIVPPSSDVVRPKPSSPDDTVTDSASDVPSTQAHVIIDGSANSKPDVMEIPLLTSNPVDPPFDVQPVLDAPESPCIGTVTADILAQAQPSNGALAAETSMNADVAEETTVKPPASNGPPTMDAEEADTRLSLARLIEPDNIARIRHNIKLKKYTSAEMLLEKLRL